MSSEEIDAANRMTDTLGDFAAELKKLSVRDKRSRLWLRILAASLVLDICITVGLGVTSVQTRDNSRAIHQSQLSGCEQNNARLARQQTAIDAILKPSSNIPAAQRPAVEKHFRRDRAEVASGWAPKDCSAAYKLP